MRPLLLLLVPLLLAPAARAEDARYRWPRSGSSETLLRIAPPEGFSRVEVEEGSFAAWLRELPLKPGRGEVRLHDGRLKPNQAAHFAVLDIDAGKRDLQQCADAAMRLRAEYLLASGVDDVCFRFTSGDLASWKQWRDGFRPKISGRKVSWARSAKRDDGYASFRAFLDQVFLYAGSASLGRDLKTVPLAKLAAGDLFLQGGYPGHAVIVLDVARDAEGRAAFLLAQSYMPAQDIHVLLNPAREGSPWYFADALEPQSKDEAAELRTPEWIFSPPVLRRFSGTGSPGSAK